MAKKEKYEWDLSTGLHPKIDPHSKIKHKIIEDYIRLYIKTLMSNQKIPRIGISIVDGFCGGGLYRDDATEEIHYGSPIIALDTVHQTVAEINTERKQLREVIAKYFFVDIKRENINYLHAVLGAKGYSHLLNKDIFTLKSPFTDALPKLISAIKSLKLSERALFLLDQYAYKDVPFSGIRTIFNEIANAEVLLTFNIDSLIDYLSDRKENRKALHNIDLEKHIPWSLLPEYKANMRHEWQHLIQRFLAEGILKESGAEYMTVFFITPFGSNPRTYWFIHLAKNYRANAVMKEIHWRYGNHFSHAMTPALFVGYDTNRDIQITDQQTLGFGEEHYFNSITSNRIGAELSELLPKQIYDHKPQTFGSLMKKIANFTMANESIVRDSLHMPILCQDIDVIDKDGRTKRRKGGSIRESDVLMPAAQRPLFFLSGTPPIPKNKDS